MMNEQEMRFKASIAAMQGILSNTQLCDAINHASHKDITVFLKGISNGAVRLADSLINELKETEK